MASPPKSNNICKRRKRDKGHRAWRFDFWLRLALGNSLIDPGIFALFSSLTLLAGGVCVAQTAPSPEVTLL